MFCVGWVIVNVVMSGLISVMVIVIVILIFVL